MPQEPKERHSKQRQGKRRASIKLNPPKGLRCSNCGALILPHRICPSCGYYKRKQVLKTKKKKERKEEKSA